MNQRSFLQMSPFSSVYCTFDHLYAMYDKSKCTAVFGFPIVADLLHRMLMFNVY